MVFSFDISSWNSSTTKFSNFLLFDRNLHKLKPPKANPSLHVIKNSSASPWDDPLNSSHQYVISLTLKQNNLDLNGKTSKAVMMQPQVIHDKTDTPQTCFLQNSKNYFYEYPKTIKNEHIHNPN